MKILRILFGIAGLFLFLGCQTDPARSPQSVRWVVPTAEQMFLRAKFTLKAPNIPFVEHHEGEDLILDWSRPVVNLSNTIFQSKYGRAGTTLYANFYHHRQFYIVRVPDSGVNFVAFENVFFPPEVLSKDIAAHTFLRFDLADGAEIEIVAKMPDEKDLTDLASLSYEDALVKMPDELQGAEYRIKHAAISDEAMWTRQDKGQKYDFVRGVRGAFVTISRFVSLETRFEEFYGDGDPIHQFSYPIKNDDGNKILRQGLVISETNGLHTFYNTLTYNCATIAFQTIQQGVGAVDPRFGFIRKIVEKNYPPLNAAKLEAMGATRIKDMPVDPTLFDVSKAAYESQIVEKNLPICAPALDERHCGNIKAAVDALKHAHRL